MSDRTRYILIYIVFVCCISAAMILTYKDGFAEGVFRTVQDYEDEKARRRWWQFWKK
jgi:hypothetical protein